MTLLHGKRHFFRRAKIESDIDNIRNCPLFDASWYLEQYPDVAAHKVDPAVHYLHTGGFEGRDPGPQFSSRKYLRSNPDVAQAKINPLLHYIRFGKHEGRSGSPGGGRRA